MEDSGSKTDENYEGSDNDMEVFQGLILNALEQLSTVPPAIEKPDTTVQEKSLIANKKSGPVVIQRPSTRFKGRENIIAKAAAYKMKQNLEIPPTFKSKSFNELPISTLQNHACAANIQIGTDSCECNQIIEKMIDTKRSCCVYFANQNPEISLPDSLDIGDDQMGVCTPSYSVSDNSKAGGTAIFAVNPVYTTKSRPCGLSHPFKVS